jgi:hypothetical protein
MGRHALYPRSFGVEYMMNSASGPRISFGMSMDASCLVSVSLVSLEGAL